MSTHFPPYKNSSENIKVELDLSNYATKKDRKDITHINASGFASKTNLAALKSEVDKIDTDKLKTVLFKMMLFRKLISVLIIMSRRLNFLQIQTL